MQTLSEAVSQVLIWCHRCNKFVTGHNETICSPRTTANFSRTYCLERNRFVQPSSLSLSTVQEQQHDACRAHPWQSLSRLCPLHSTQRSSSGSSEASTALTHLRLLLSRRLTATSGTRSPLQLPVPSRLTTARDACADNRHLREQMVKRARSWGGNSAGLSALLALTVAGQRSPAGDFALLNGNQSCAQACCSE